MPREIVHWRVLDSARQQMDPSLSAARILGASRALAELGAVGHDAPFYLNGGRHELNEVGNVLHSGERGDPAAPLISCVEVLAATKDSELRRAGWPFVLGLLSHAITDITFHPLIFFLTGDYHDREATARRKAQQRHRIVEVYLDIWFREHSEPWRAYSISSRLQSAAADREVIEVLLAEGLLSGMARSWTGMERYADPEVARLEGRNWYKGLEDMAFYQKLFFSPIVGAAGILLKKFSPERFGPLEALCLFGRENTERTWCTFEFEYQNPITGEQYCHSPQVLFETSAIHCAKIFSDLSPLVSGETAVLPDSLLALRQVSLNYGVLDAHQRQPKYFSPTGVKLRGLDLAKEGQ